MLAYIYVEESDNFDLSARSGASRFFLLTTVVINDHAIEPDLLELRRQPAWDELSLTGGFHASVDNQIVRSRVFGILCKHDFMVDTTIIEKRKAEPQIRATNMQLYEFAWFSHMRQVAPRVVSPSDSLLVVAASIGNKREQAALISDLQDVMNQTSPTSAVKTAMWPAASDPCRQVEDYCSWAIFRKWERADTRAYEIIADKMSLENDLFSSGNTFYH